ncbi:hypothetical protein INS49_005561 [Diaporthe citri]|uniref:uncharacterized protein n=1 Tax=Diaporthe citri TaxID=83186 RepID=UPI001C8271CD|nr:uncharacterized protein INS49_005561 [Diaporthe citri]KAG6353599.1 hypothetical protein INS49_005561 [Diaporthe citri]
MSFDDSHHQQLYQGRPLHSTNYAGSWSSPDHGLGPPGELRQLAFVDPSILQLGPSQPGQEDPSSFSDATIEANSASEASSFPFSCFSSVHHSFFSYFPDMQEPIGIANHSFGVAEVQAFMGVEIDEGLFDNPEAGGFANLDNLFADVPQDLELMDIDEYFPDTAEIPETTKTDEQLFDRPEIRELGNIDDDCSDTPETPESMQIDVEETERVSDCHPPSLAPSSPPSSAPPSPIPRYPESEDGVYLVERIIQVRGPKHRRQYLIRWEGWGPEFDTWEPARNVSAELRAEFERSRRRRRHPRRR